MFYQRSLRAEGSPVSYEFYTSFKDITFRNYIKKGRSEFADSCHQCRTKSDLKKVQCTAIRKYTGMRCSFKWDKSCLLKYNQKLNVALNNPKWRCPVCEGRCDCSRCRIKRGLRPYGNSWRIIRCTDTDDEDEDISGDKSVSIECNEDGNKAQAALFVTKPIVRERRKTAIYNRKYNFSRSIEVPKENSMDHSKKATYSLKKETRPLKILIKNSLKLDSILDQKMKDLTMKISQ
ncbi:hypothetical protein PHYBLDRAFT_165666 [Phycomyces blakesleeanus NRRL 1555(-)]|uniref:Zinc-finger domain-containing protein n=1 Tax=Phycomyces blakesleeanus (strain ATCC 8743b / DSM 1359 / FGSC 10004 / NBRC 33097 / NRRL 1555) TaxID=763407 RepID=A0A167P3K9_PHYB8|nr:hypothetical protein PHYBLDRAFT_165666 [Phycomyces blakesleeanus NRRL 1555(-)]OAD77178.1 hypothetical protein PHYBLDRAFT_165666 [Phycomyces blakesleeanus NRRL 1555(-)]|eukprot:XP_018295218.1 hypothetical protein PHYBLDRAFT_165666 [Phycomyces blakesleeanus NRRL 1555(-)]